jgi:polyribonucleotide nucleotidyltransferase
MIQAITEEPEVGRIYEGVVKSTTSFGAFVEIMPGTEGLCHISELQDGRTEKTEDVVKKGDVVHVKLLSIDEKGRLRLSRKARSPRWARARRAEPRSYGGDTARERGGRACHIGASARLFGGTGNNSIPRPSHDHDHRSSRRRSRRTRTASRWCPRAPRR